MYIHMHTWAVEPYCGVLSGAVKYVRRTVKTSCSAASSKRAEDALLPLTSARKRAPSREAQRAPLPAENRRQPTVRMGRASGRASDGCLGSARGGGPGAAAPCEVGVMGAGPGPSRPPRASDSSGAEEGGPDSIRADLKTGQEQEPWGWRRGDTSESHTGPRQPFPSGWGAGTAGPHPAD